MIKFGDDGRSVFKLDIGGICNNKCRFCYQHLRQRFFSTKKCKSLFKRYRKGRDLLIISGGEPTLHPDLLDIIYYARKKLNFEHIQLETNAGLFSDSSFLNRFLVMLSNSKPVISDSIENKSDFSFRVSIYSHQSNIHDSITQSPGSFIQTIKGIRNLLNYGQEVVSNTVINKINFKHLREISDFLTKIKIKSQEFSFIHETRDKNYRTYSIKYSQLQPYLKKLIDYVQNNSKIKLFLENIPFCFIRGSEHLASENYYPLGENKRLLYYTISNQIKKTEYEKIDCPYKSKCFYEFICRGLDKQYVKEFGIAEFQPIKYQYPKALFNEDVLEYIKKREFNAIAFLSGGIDSKCATALYCEKFPERKILLITFDNPGVIFSNKQRASLEANELMAKFKNIVGYIKIKIPREFFRKHVIDKTTYWERKKGINLTCNACGMVWVCLSIILVKKIKNSRKCDFIFGHRVGSNFPRSYFQFMKLFLQQYSIQLVLSVFEFLAKEKIIRKLKSLGLTSKSNQGHCLLTKIRYSHAKGSENSFRGYDRFKDLKKKDIDNLKVENVINDPFFKYFSDLLREYEVKPNNISENEGKIKHRNC